MAIFSPSPTYPKPLPIPTQSSSPLPFSIHSLRLSLPPSPLSTGPTPRLSRCHAALSPQPPPQSDPPPGKDPQVGIKVQQFLMCCGITVVGVRRGGRVHVRVLRRLCLKKRCIGSFHDGEQFMANEVLPH